MDKPKEKKIFKLYEQFSKEYQRSLSIILSRSTKFDEYTVWKLASHYEGPLIDEMWVYGVRTQSLWTQAIQGAPVCDDQDKRKKYLAGLKLYTPVDVDWANPMRVKVYMRLKVLDEKIAAELNAKENENEIFHLHEEIVQVPEPTSQEDSQAIVEVSDNLRMLENIKETREEVYKKEIDIAVLLEEVAKEDHLSVETKKFDEKEDSIIGISNCTQAETYPYSGTGAQDFIDAFPESVSHHASYNAKGNAKNGGIFNEMAKYYGSEIYGKAFDYNSDVVSYGFCRSECPKEKHRVIITSLVDTNYKASDYVSFAQHGYEAAYRDNWAYLHCFSPVNDANWVTKRRSDHEVGLYTSYMPILYSPPYNASSLLDRMIACRKKNKDKHPSCDSMVSGFLGFPSYGCSEDISPGNYIEIYERIALIWEQCRSRMKEIAPGKIERYKREHTFSSLEALSYTYYAMSDHDRKDCRYYFYGSISGNVEKYWNEYFPQARPISYKHRLHDRNKIVDLRREGGKSGEVVVIGSPFPLFSEKERPIIYDPVLAPCPYNLYSIQAFFYYLTMHKCDYSTQFVVRLRTPYGNAFMKLYEWVKNTCRGMKVISCGVRKQDIVVCIGEQRKYPPLRGELEYALTLPGFISGEYKTLFNGSIEQGVRTEHYFPCWGSAAVDGNDYGQDLANYVSSKYRIGMGMLKHMWKMANKEDIASDNAKKLKIS